MCVCVRERERCGFQLIHKCSNCCERKTESEREKKSGKWVCVRDICIHNRSEREKESVCVRERESEEGGRERYGSQLIYP